MDSLQHHIDAYTNQLRVGHIQIAYRGLIMFMSQLKLTLATKYPDFKTSELYLGYMDMTYFAWTPPSLQKRKLKIAIVYHHQLSRFEIWLAAINRGLQADYQEKLTHIKISPYQLTALGKGVDAIIESVLIDKPNFDKLQILLETIEHQAMEFVCQMITIMNQIEG